MKKPLALAGLSLFVLIGAAYPETPQLHYGAAVLAGSTEVTGPTYRPCRRDPRDDRCIQLYERGVRAAYAQWLNEHGVGGPDDRTAEAPRRERTRSHRRERIAMTRVRCVTEGNHDAAHDARDHERHRDHGDRREHREHRQHREQMDHRDGEVRGM